MSVEWKCGFVSKEKMTTEHIKWDTCLNQASDDSISAAQEIIPYRIPNLYFDLMRNCDAGVPLETEFEYYDVSHKCILPQSLGCYLGLEDEEYNIVELYQNPPEFFPKGLLAFAETGCGNFLCFDFREDPECKQPNIVFWRSGAMEGRDISFIASHMDAFLEMLAEYKE